MMYQRCIVLNDTLMSKLSRMERDKYRSVYCSGSTYTEITKVMELADVHWFSKTLFYDYQHSHILPVIQDRFDNCLMEAREKVLTSGMFAKPSSRFSLLKYVLTFCHLRQQDGGLCGSMIVK